MEKVFARTKGLTDTAFSFCPGCTHGIIMRIIAEVLEELNIIEETVGISPVGCAGFCQDFFSCDFVGAPHGRAQAVGIGVKRALPDKTVFTYQGDGDIAAIGTQHAIHAAARGEKITSIMVNNAIYGMTGGQMAPTTLEGMKTSTSPHGRNAITDGLPMDFPRLIANLEGAVYVASVSVDTPKNIIQAKKAIKRAFEVQREGLGFALVSVLSTCPTNWGMSPLDSLKWLRENMMSVYAMGELKVTKEVERL
ncbi:thiamine pyrophosphate-dependent enzyme [Clostridium formicaceticum]|uniref:2-oxoglutarate oxidoreductase n=1 Tax=Clostridium formicaceticum TaxID=1497 RepID=A0AAC9WI70_9CLOT|nr:thiamine pyrophosphate-dependent enzyme [Clostridium formicaceticum]AOY75265.1 2-oxoglutarate oxidoreductase [Clostridium formicaceticum]ARE89701.1 2-oxoglutarate oxidoreductase subunit KorB [Clostridium formicaceticum]